MKIKKRTFGTKWVGNGFGELSIGTTQSEIWDLSFYNGPRSSETLVCGIFSKTLENKHVQKRTFGTKWVGNRFHELSTGRNYQLGLGTSTIEVLAKQSKKNEEKR